MPDTGVDSTDMRETVQVPSAGSRRRKQADGLEEIDLLRLQNAFLKVHALDIQGTSIKTQFEVLRRDAARVDKEMGEAQKDLQEIRNGISSKYGIDLSTTTVNQEGKFVPLRANQTPFPVPGQSGG